MSENNQANQLIPNNNRFNPNKYISSQFLLEHVLNEFNQEYERLKTIENRIPILITIATFFGGILLSKDYSNYYYMLKNGEKKLFVFIGIHTLCYFLLILSIVIFTSLLFSIKYRRLPITSFKDIKFQSKDKGLLAFDILKQYIACYEHNQKVNSKKTIIYNVGLVSLALSAILYFIIKIITLF